MLRNNKKLSVQELKTIYGDAIRKFRDEKCLTQSYVASKLGVGQSTYQKMESGIYKIKIERLEKIAEILGKPIDAFLEGGITNAHANLQAELSKPVLIAKVEHEFLQKLILQQEKMIEELLEKVQRKNKKIDALTALLKTK